MASSIPQLRRGLHEALLAEFNADDVLVAYAVPRDRRAREIILRGFVDTSEEAAEIGGGRRRERYEQMVEVSVYDPAADSPDVVEDQAMQMIDRVRAVINRAGTFNGVLVLPAGVSAVNSPSGVLPGETSGYGIQVTVSIACNARITTE